MITLTDKKTYYVKLTTNEIKHSFQLIKKV